jgi:hypothetical protein
MIRRTLVLSALFLILVVTLIGAMATYAYRRTLVAPTSTFQPESTEARPLVDGTTSLRLSPQAFKNLGIVSKSLEITTYWRHIEIPGVVTDRPGISDRGVVTPITGVVTGIHAYPRIQATPSSPMRRSSRCGR